MVSSCEPRIKMDEGQWGTHAEITSGVFLYQWIVDDIVLSEGEVEGAKRVSVTDDSIVDEDNFTVTTTVETGTDLTKVACYIYHNGNRVEPLNGAPKPGKVDDYSAKEFKYRIHSADGKYKDWTIEIVVQ